jgi:hypothetical protein
MKKSRGLRIAFGCKAGTGKSESVKYLIQKYGGTELSFAKPLYEILHFSQEKCGFPIEKDRKFLQYIGTWARKKDPNVWVRLLCEKLEEIPKEENIFVSDVRFPNEFNALKHKGFTMVLINRDISNEPWRNHLSENQELKSWDFTINNNFSLEDLHYELNKICEEK